MPLSVGVRAHRRAPQLVAAGVDHAAPPCTKVCSLARAAAADDVLHRHAQRRVLGFDAHGLDDDQIAEPLLQRALHEHLRGRRQHVAVGREHQLQQAAAEIRPHDALARAGEQHLLDQIANVIGVAGLRRAAAAIEPIGKIDVGHGLHPRHARLRHRRRSAACRSARRSPGCRSAGAARRSETRVADVVYCASHRGRCRRSAAATCNRRLTYMLLSATAGWPLTSTRGFGARRGLAGVSCTVTVAPR